MYAYSHALSSLSLSLSLSLSFSYSLSLSLSLLPYLLFKILISPTPTSLAIHAPSHVYSHFNNWPLFVSHTHMHSLLVRRLAMLCLVEWKSLHASVNTSLRGRMVGQKRWLQPNCKPLQVKYECVHARKGEGSETKKDKERERVREEREERDGGE